MNRKTRKAVAFAAALLTLGTVTVAFAATSPPLVGVTKSSMNGVNRASGPHGALKANAVGNRQIKFGSVSCGKLSADLVAAICTGQPGAPGTPGAPGANGSKGSSGSNGSNGSKGDGGSNGNDGSNGSNGSNGLMSPLMYGPYNGTSTDSGVCGDWAHDTWTVKYLVSPQSDGSFTVTALVKGTFVTLAGYAPNGPCDTTAPIPAGVTGALYGDYAIAVPVGADFNPYADCPGLCGGDTGHLGTAVATFLQAHFKQGLGSTYAWQFHYDAGASHGTWDNTDHTTPPAGGNIH